jgi:hypothetical protein
MKRWYVPIWRFAKTKKKVWQGVFPSRQEMTDFVLPYGVFKRYLLASLLVIENRWWDGITALTKRENALHGEMGRLPFPWYLSTIGKVLNGR